MAGLATVLVVDDNPQLQRLLSEICRAAECDALLAESKAQMLAIARSAQPDLILLDGEFADGSEMDAIRDLRSDPATSAIPVILLSCFPPAPLLDAAVAAGATIRLPKPFRASELIEKIKICTRPV